MTTLENKMVFPTLVTENSADKLWLDIKKYLLILCSKCHKNFLNYLNYIITKLITNLDLS